MYQVMWIPTFVCPQAIIVLSYGCDLSKSSIVKGSVVFIRHQPVLVMHNPCDYQQSVNSPQLTTFRNCIGSSYYALEHLCEFAFIFSVERRWWICINERKTWRNLVNFSAIRWGANWLFSARLSSKGQHAKDLYWPHVLSVTRIKMNWRLFICWQPSRLCLSVTKLQ